MDVAGGRSVNHQYYIGAPRDRVFRAISQPEWLVRWLCDVAEISPRKGGEYLLGWNGGPQHRGRILEYRKGSVITFGWSWPGVPLEGTRFRLGTKRRGKGTLLTVDHFGFPRDDKWVDLYGGAEWGWTYFAMNLKSVLETWHDLRSEPDG